MDALWSAPGDSGTGLSNTTKAFGSLTGTCNWNGVPGDLFTVADYFDDALGSDSHVLY